MAGDVRWRNPEVDLRGGPGAPPAAGAGARAAMRRSPARPDSVRRRGHLGGRGSNQQVRKAVAARQSPRAWRRLAANRAQAQLEPPERPPPRPPLAGRDSLALTAMRAGADVVP